MISFDHVSSGSAIDVMSFPLVLFVGDKNGLESAIRSLSLSLSSCRLYLLVLWMQHNKKSRHYIPCNPFLLLGQTRRKGTILFPIDSRSCLSSCLTLSFTCSPVLLPMLAVEDERMLSMYCLFLVSLW